MANHGDYSKVSFLENDDRFKMRKQKRVKYDEAKEAAMVEDRFNQVRTQKLDFHDTWWNCHSFWDGDQYVTYRRGIPVRHKSPSWRVRLSMNFIDQLVATVVAKLTQNRPVPVPKRVGSGNQAKFKAQAANTILRYQEHNVRLDQLRNDVCFYAADMGTGLARTFWDDFGGRRADGAPTSKVLSPFDLYPDPRAAWVHEARWLIISHWMYRDEIAEKWPDTYKQIFVASDHETWKYGSGAGEGDDHWRDDITGYQNRSEDEDVMRVLEYQERPNAKYPNGRRLFVCHGRVLEFQKSLPARMFTVAQMKYTAPAERFWGKGPVENTIPVQQQFNRTGSQLVEIRNLHVNPIWMAPRKCIRPGQIIGGRPDLVVDYDPSSGGKPERLDPPAMPSALRELLWAFLDIAERVSGVHEASKGEMPSNDASGRAIKLLADLDAMKLGPAVRSLEAFSADVAVQHLWMWRNYQKKSKTVSVFGKNRRVETSIIHSTDIEDFVEVEVTPGSAMHYYPSVQRDNAKEAWQLGGFGDVTDPENQAEFRESMGIRGMEDWTTDTDDDVQYARRENKDMEVIEGEADQDAILSAYQTGDPAQVAQALGAPVPLFLEDHAAHFREHRSDILQAEFTELPQIVQLRKLVHAALHLHEMAEQQAGWATYADLLGLDPQNVLGMAQDPAAAQMAMQPEPPPPPEQGLISGGQPELNGATAALQGEPGYAPQEEFYAAG